MGEADIQPLITRCPECGTQFRVSEAQLQVAKGKVRCGSCLHVFEGVDNLVWDADSAPAGSPDEALDDLLDELVADPGVPGAGADGAPTEAPEIDPPSADHGATSAEVAAAEDPYQLIDPLEQVDLELPALEPSANQGAAQHQPPEPAPGSVVNRQATVDELSTWALGESQ